MAGIGRYKLSDSVPQANQGGRSAGGKAGTAPGILAKQVREAQENRKARGAGPSTRDRMVEIGRGQQQAGRQGGS